MTNGEVDALVSGDNKSPLVYGTSKRRKKMVRTKKSLGSRKEPPCEDARFPQPQCPPVPFLGRRSRPGLTQPRNRQIWPSYRWIRAGKELTLQDFPRCESPNTPAGQQTIDKGDERQGNGDKDSNGDRSVSVLDNQSGCCQFD